MKFVSARAALALVALAMSGAMVACSGSNDAASVPSSVVGDPNAASDAGAGAMGQPVTNANGDDAAASTSSSGDDSDASGSGVVVSGGDDDGGQGIIEGPPPTVTGADALYNEAQSILGALKSTKYQHATNVDVATGTFDLDCSGFMNYALATGVSDAYNTLLSTSMVARPVAQTYVDFIAALALPKGRWHHVTHAADLIPGDVIAWKIPPGVVSSDTGHIMIVDGAPVAFTGLNEGDAGISEVHVAIIDSTETGHGKSDARTPTGVTGVGRGTVALIVGADGDATGYKWSTDPGSPPYADEVILAHLD